MYDRTQLIRFHDKHLYSFSHLDIKSVYLAELEIKARTLCMVEKESPAKLWPQPAVLNPLLCVDICLVVWCIRGCSQTLWNTALHFSQPLRGNEESPSSNLGDFCLFVCLFLMLFYVLILNPTHEAFQNFLSTLTSCFTSSGCVCPRLIDCPDTLIPFDFDTLLVTLWPTCVRSGFTWYYPDPVFEYLNWKIQLVRHSLFNYTLPACTWGGEGSWGGWTKLSFWCHLFCD